MIFKNEENFTAYRPNNKREQPRLRLQVDQVWFVRMPGAASLSQLKVVEVHKYVVGLRRVSLLGLAPEFFKISDLEFVELMENK